MKGWTKHDLDLAKAGAMLRDYAVMCESDPLDAVVFMDRQRRHRRILATYADGWSLQINFTAKGAVGSYSMTYAWRGEVKK